MHPQGARTALGALPGLVILLLTLLLLVGKGFFPNCTIPMRIHLCKLPSGHVHCIEKERKRIFKYFLWLNKTFLLNSSSRISNANRMQAALSHFSSPLWGFTIWNVFELQLPIVHEVCLFLFPSSPLSLLIPVSKFNSESALACSWGCWSPPEQYVHWKCLKHNAVHFPLKTGV